MSLESRFGLGGGIRHSDGSIQNLLKPFCLMAIVMALLLTTVSIGLSTSSQGVSVYTDSETVTELDEMAYYSLGTEFDVDLGRPFLHSLTPGFGLDTVADENGRIHLTGTLEATGICKLVIDYNMGATTYWILVPYEIGDETYGSEGVPVKVITSPVSGTFEDVLMLYWMEDPTFSIKDTKGYYEVYDYNNPDNRNEDNTWNLRLNNANVNMYEYWMCLLELFPDYLTPGFESWDEYNSTLELILEDLGPYIRQCTPFNFIPTIFLVEGNEYWRIVEVEEVYTECAILEIPTPSKEGYTFTGWYEDPECTIPWTMLSYYDWLGGSIFEDYMPARFIYAGWEPDDKLEFLSDPSDPLYAIITYVKT